MLHDNIIILRFKRVPFGVISSPFLLPGVLLYHLSQHPDVLMGQLSKDIYVDNLFSGASDIEGAKKLYDLSKSTFQDASMDLTQWVTPCGELFQHIPLEDRADEGECKLLGCKYNMLADVFHVAVCWCH